MRAFYMVHNGEGKVMRDQNEIAVALVHRLAAHFDIEVDDEAVDRDQSFLNGPGLTLDGQLLDSFDLVDALTRLEEELKVRLSDGELQELDTVNRVADAIRTVACPQDIDGFCAQWL